MSTLVTIAEKITSDSILVIADERVTVSSPVTRDKKRTTFYGKTEAGVEKVFQLKNNDAIFLVK